MGILHQVKLLFLKNWLFRIRSPGILILELLWPVLVVGIVSIMRLGAGPIRRGNCHYQPRAMPSAGAVQFLQTFVCNINNKCYRSEQHLQLSQAFTQQFVDLSQDLGSILGSSQALDVLNVSKQTAQVFDTMNKIIGDGEILDGLEKLMNISYYFKNPEKVKRILVYDQQVMSWDQAEALLDAQLNVDQLLNLTGTPDFKFIACNPNELSKYVKLPAESNVTSISSTLCKMSEAQITDFSNLLIKEVDIASLINAVKMIETVKDKFEGSDGLTFALEALSEMFEVVTKSEPVFELLGKLSAIPDIADLIRRVPYFIRNFKDFDSFMNVLRELIKSLDPIMKNLDAEQNLIWTVVKDAVGFTDHMSQLVEGKWNGTSEEFIDPLKSLVTGVDKLSKEEGTHVLIAVMDFISKNDWLVVYDEIIYNSALSEKTLTTLATSLQNILEQTSMWPDFQNGLNVAYHFLDMMSIIIEKSIELRKSLKPLLLDKGFVNALNKILQYGPSVTNTFLEAIRNPSVIGDIMRTATTYQDVCERIVRDMKGKIPNDIHSDVKDILCSEDTDFSKVMNTITGKLNLSQVLQIMNSTVLAVENLYEGEFFNDSVALSDLFPIYNRFTKGIDNYLYDDLTWMNVFNGISIDQINTNERAWEPIASLLNEDYISSVFLGLYQGFGQVLGNSRISQDIGPGVHMLSELLEGFYGLLEKTGDLTSPESKMMKMAHMVTSYMPEMVSAISYMVTNATNDVYFLASSSDPLKTFCDEGYMIKMNMPSYVPVNEMNSMICLTDWDTEIRQMEDTIKTMTSLATKIENAFNMNDSAIYDVEMDWSKMVDYSSRLWDLIRMGNIAGIIDMTTSSVKFFNQFNFTRMEETMDILSTEIESMDSANMEKLFEVGIRILENVDKNADMSGDWAEIHRYLAIAEAYMEIQMDSIKQSQSMSSLSEILKMYPKDMATITLLLAKAYPKFVSAMADIFYKPNEYVSFLTSNGFPTPDCKNHFVMDYMHLPRDSAPHNLELFLCNLNMTDFLTQLMNAQQSQKFTERLVDLIEGKSSNITIDWRKMIGDFEELIKAFDTSTASQVTSFDMAPFNLTAIDLSWQEFYKAAESASLLDPNKMQELIADIGKLSSEFLSSIDDQGDLQMAFYVPTYINYRVSEFIVKELQFFNESSEVIIFDYLGSNELKKIASFLEKSPDINAVGIATFQRLLNNYGKVPMTFDFDALCSNVSLFKNVFVIEASPLQPAVLQDTICREITAINITLAFEEVAENRNSLQDFLNAMSILETNYTLADIKVPFDEVVKKSGQITALIESITISPPIIKITADESWMNMTMYTTEWDKLGEKLNDFSTDDGIGNTSFSRALGGVFVIMDQLSDTDPTVKEMFRPVSVMMAVLDELVTKVLNLENKASFGITELFEGWTNMQHMMRFIQLPGVLDVLIASSSSPSFSSLFSEEGFKDFCSPSTPSTKYLTAPQNIAVDLLQMKTELCNFNSDVFVKDLDSFINIDKLERVANGSSDYDWSAFEDKAKRMNDLINKWISQPPKFQLPTLWTNESYWQNLLDNQILTLADSKSAKEQVMVILDQLGPLLDMDGFKQIGMILNSALDIANANIKAMEGQSYTVENMFVKIPAVRNLFDGLGLDSDVFQSLLVSPIKNSSLFIEILLSDDMRKDFCMGDKWNKVIDFPSDFNTSALFAAFCKDDVDALLTNLQKKFNLETMISQLEDGKSHLQDWKNATEKMFTLIENVEDLIDNPPSFNADKFVSVLTENYNLTNLMKLASAASALQNTFLKESEIFKPLSSIFSIAQVMVNFLDDIMARVKLQNGQLDLASLFRDIPEIQKVIKSILHLNPDPVTGLFSIQLKPEKVDKFVSMVTNMTQLRDLFCSKTKFEQVFTVDPKVNISHLLDGLCGLDFDSLAQKLSDSFKVDSLTKEISAALDSDYNFDGEKFTEAVNSLISHIMNLTSTKQVTFEGHVLDKVFQLNFTKLMEVLEGQGSKLEKSFTGDYAAMASQVVSSVLEQLKGFTDTESLVTALRFMQSYLHSFNSFLNSVKDQPITLALLLNNTEVGHILNPILKNPISLEGLKDATVNIKKLDSLLSQSSPRDGLCGNELWSAINVTDATSKQMVVDLQQNVCSVNETLLLWQTIMLQANGLKLYEQIDFIRKDLEQGKASTDTKAVAEEMNEFITLISTLVTQYVNGSRSLEDIVDVNSFKNLLDSLQSQLTEKLLDSVETWSVDITEILLPKVLDQVLYQNMAKTLNSVNLFMNVTIEQLTSIKDGRVSASVLFKNSDLLIKMMEAYIRTGKNLAKAWSDNEFDPEKLTKLLEDMNQLTSLCGKPEGISLEISNTTYPSQTVKDMSTVICSVIGSNVTDELKKLIDYDHIGNTLQSLWNSNQVKPDYATFVNNVNKFTSLVEDLAKTSFNVSSSLSDLFKFDSFTSDLSNIVSSPEVIFRMMKLLGIFIEDPLRNEPELVKSLSQMNSFVLMPLTHILEALQGRGATIEKIFEDPDAWLDVLSVAVDFDVHFDIIREFAVKPQLRGLGYNQGFYCSDEYYLRTIETEISGLQLPINGQQIYTIICNSSSTKWLQKFDEMGLTNIQITVLVDQLMSGYDVLNLYDKNFGWVNLMSSMERLSALITSTDDNNKVDVPSMKTAWDHVKHLVFDKTFKSLLSYLQLFEGSQPQDEGWVEFRQFLKFFSSVMKFLDSNLENINAQGKPIQMKDILPDSETVSNLLKDLFGQQSASEFLVTAVNPEVFFRISISDTWETICNQSNSKMFTKYFQFPNGTRVDDLKNNICQAVSTRKASFQQLLSLFNAGDMLKQLDMLIEGQYSSSGFNVSVWDTTHSVMMHLIGTLENLQHAWLDASSFEDYFIPILNTLNSLSSAQSSQIVSLCDAMVLYLNKTEGYADAKQMVSYAITTTNLLTDLATLVPDFDEVVCSLGATDKLDLVALARKLTDIGLMSIIDKAGSMYNKPPNSLRCSDPLTSSETLMKVINSTIEENLIDGHRVDMCFQNIERGMRNSLSSISNAAEFIKSIGEVLQMPGLANLFQGEDWIPIVDFVIDVYDANENSTLLFEDLLKDKVNASQYLTSGLGLSDSLVASLMNATVNDNWENILRQSLVEIEDILCNPDRLTKAINLPEKSLFTITDISQQLCLHNETADLLKSLSTPMDGVSGILKVLSQMTDDISKAFVEFKDIIEFLFDLLTNFNFDMIEEDVDLIDKILQNNEFSNLGLRIKSILHGIKNLANGNKAIANVLNDVETIVDGLLSIDFLKQATMESLKVKDIIEDQGQVRSYMKMKLGFSDQQVEDIMNSTFSLRVILGIDEKPQYTCENLLKMLIIMNDTRATYTNLENAFCSLDSKQLEELFNALKVEISIGDLVSKYVSFTADSVLKATNLSMAELSDVVEKIDRGQYILAQATNTFYSNSNGTALLDLFGQSSTEALTSMDGLAPLICGDDITDIFATDFTPGVVISTKEDLAQELKDGVKTNEDDLDNEFCVTIYESVKKSSLGGILWAYLKPIMRGKILYTPVNDVTQRIVEKTNKTFADLQRIEEIANIWASGTSNLNTMIEAANDTDGLRDALKNDFIKGILKSTIGVSSESIISGLDALQANNVGPTQLNALKTAAELVANLTSCIEFNRFEGVESEEELEKIAYSLSRKKLFFAGIVFMDSDDSASNNGKRRRKRQSNVEIPKHVSYKIRMDVDNVMDTNYLKSTIWKMIAEDNFVEDMRYLRGFVQIQDMLDQAIIDLHKDPAHTIPGSRLKQFPFPCHHIDNFIFILGSYLIPVMMTFVFLASIGVATYNLVYDRENGQEQSLQVMGMKSGLNFVVWLLSTMFLMAVVSFVMAIMLKYTDVFIYSNYFVLFVYILTFCLSSVMLLYMVSAFFNRTTMAILFVLMIYLISYLPYILVISMEVDMEFWHKIVACLASTTAFSFGAHNLAKLEEMGQGLQWSNIHSEAAENFSMYWAFIMMLVDSGIYFLVGWYVRHVKPGKYGIPQPWYFPILPCFWSSCFNSCSLKSSSKDRSSQYVTGFLFEASPKGYDVGITIENLSKSYGKKRVLDNLNLDIYKGQITCLLGHNGAAKTTTLKMMYGMLDPTSGKIRIHGKKPSQCKNLLGMCPQQNALFDYMSVMEHMEFYAGVKRGGTSVKTLKEIKKLLEDVDLWHERKVKARNLSYGMKRRLCVALAFVGRSDVVLLDEPTSGVDPHARRNIWNLISGNREGRTILLSTHHLDEADIIGDRIAFMHTGRLLACGSPAFLKKSIGGGFKLSIMKDVQSETSHATEERSNNQNEVILNFVKSMCPEAALADSRGNDLWINIPKEEEKMKVPHEVFFKELDQKSKDIGIVGYGISDTTLEEIFLTLTNKADKEKEKGTANLAIEEDGDFTQLRGAEESLDSTPSNIDVKRRKQGSSLVFQQIKALIIKRCIHYHRNWRMLLTCFLLPLVCFLIGMAFSTIRPDEGHSKALLLDPIIYGEDTYTFFKKEKEARGFKADALTLGFMDSKVGVGTTCMKDFNGLDTGFSIDCLNMSTQYNVSTPFYLPRCENARQSYYPLGGLVSTVKEELTPNRLRQQDLDGQNIPFYLLRTFRDYKDQRFGGWSLDESVDNGASQVDPYVWFNSKAYHAMPSFFNSLSNVLLRTHLPIGENPDEYGITAISHPVHLGRNALTMKTVQNDAADAGIAIVVVVAFSFIPCGFMLYLIAERMQKEKQLQHISGVGLFMYWITAFICDLILFGISVGISVIIVCIFKTDAFYVRSNLQAFTSILLLYGWAIIPFQYFLTHFFKKGSTAFLVAFCLNLFLALVTIISLLVLQLFKYDNVAWRAYEECRWLFLIFPQYALGQGLMEMVANTVKYEILKRFDEDFYEDPFSMDILGWHLVALAIFGFFFFILNLLWETKKSSALSVPKSSKLKNKSMDPDVAKEKERILHASNNDVLTVDELSKVYRRRFKKFCAVNNISFGVPEGECFGLLGVNGAGKTTTFRMLTGDLTSSSGTSRLNGVKVSSKSHQLRQGVGYCPQEGGLDEYLTATETLYFHARLKGFDKEQTKAIAEELLTLLHLQPYADQAVHKYSGGTKRKLALAVAMLGNPPILYLDEPTTGMDAATRRLAWRCIAKANRNGQSVVLTSHMMDECDALCSRIAIMVNGEIKCLGSPQHLKQRFGEGYTAIIHGQNELLSNVADYFIQKFPASIIQVRHFTSLQVMIPHNGGHVSDIIAFLRQAQLEGQIEYYTLSQTTLDSVFINFAQEQSDHFYDSTSSSYTPSDNGSQEDTPTGSISSTKYSPSSSSGSEVKNKKGPVFVNPQFTNDAFVGEEYESNPPTRYVTNLSIGAHVSPKYEKSHAEPEYDNGKFTNEAFVKENEDSHPYDNSRQSEPRNVSNIRVTGEPKVDYDNPHEVTQF